MTLDGFVRPHTYMADPNQERARVLFRGLFEEPDPTAIGPAVAAFLAEHLLPIHDFPALERSYSRTILYRAANGYEAMAARWGEGARSPVHGHPMYLFYYVLAGELQFDNYEKTAQGVCKTGTTTCGPGGFFSLLGVPGAFDNGIHRVRAMVDSLSVHIYSDNALKGEVFTVPAP